MLVAAFTLAATAFTAGTPLAAGAAGPGWSFVQANWSGANGIPSTNTFATPTRAGDRIVVAVSQFGLRAFVGITDSGGNSYSQVRWNQADNFEMEVWTAVVAVPSIAVTVRLTDGSISTTTLSKNSFSTVVAEYAGLSTADSFDAVDSSPIGSGFSPQGSTVSTVSGLPTSQPDELVFGAFFAEDFGGGSGLGPGGGFTARSNTGVWAGGWAMVEDADSGAAGSTPGASADISASNVGDWIGIAVIFRLPKLPSDSCASPTLTVIDGNFAGVLLRLIEQAEAQSDVVCFRIAAGGSSEGGNVVINAGPPGAGAPTTDANAQACSSTPGNAIPGPHPLASGVILNQPTLIDTFAGGGAVWVCLQVGTTAVRLIIPVSAGVPSLTINLDNPLDGRSQINVP